MLIKDKDITSYQLLLIKQDRVLVLASLTSVFDYTVVNLELFFSFFFFYFSKKMSRSGDGKRNILLGWPNERTSFVTKYTNISLEKSGPDIVWGSKWPLHTKLKMDNLALNTLHDLFQPLPQRLQKVKPKQKRNKSVMLDWHAERMYLIEELISFRNWM